MARIKHPHPQLGRMKDRLGGIEFIDGFATVDLSDKPVLAAAYAQHGYEVQHPLEEVAADLTIELDAGEAVIPLKRSRKTKAERDEDPNAGPVPLNMEP